MTKIHPNIFLQANYCLAQTCQIQVLRPLEVDTPFLYVYEFTFLECCLLKDIQFSGICANKAGIKPRSNVYFTYNLLHNDTCEYSNLITMHRFDPTMILNTYDKLNSLIKSCKPSFNAQKWLMNNVFKPRVYKKKCE